MGVGLSRCLDDPLLLPFLFGRVVDVGLQSFLGRARRGYCLGMLACALCGAIAVGICRAVADVACGEHTSKSLLSKGSVSIGKENQRLTLPVRPRGVRKPCSLPSLFVAPSPMPQMSFASRAAAHWRRFSRRFSSFCSVAVALCSLLELTQGRLW